MTDPRVAKTRAALAESVLALASEKPFAEVTITEIAERAGVGYASFFRHYRDKDALLADVADTLVDDITRSRVDRLGVSAKRLRTGVHRPVRQLQPRACVHIQSYGPQRVCGEVDGGND